MSASPEINMEAYFGTGSINDVFDESVDDEYPVGAELDTDEPVAEDNDTDKESEDEESHPQTAMLPIATNALRAGPHAQDDQEILFRELMRDHQKRLYRFVIRYIDHPDDAADITQQAFAEAARTISSFRGDSKLSTWLYGIAMNMVRNYMRKLIEQDLYELPVLSYQELTPEVNIQPLARVEI